MTKVNVELNGKCHELPLVITERSEIFIMGLNWMHTLNIKLFVNSLTSNANNDTTRRLQDMLGKYEGIFKDNNAGIMNHWASIPICEGAKPSIVKPRRVPFAMKELVEQELKQLVERKILEPVDPAKESLKWSCATVNVTKPDGSIRICGDFRCSINKYAIVPPYPLPTFDEILDKIKDGKKYSILDLKDAYLQLPLDKKSQDMACIATHIGFFKYLRLPFGVSSAPAIFQATIDKILYVIPHVACYLDDIIITGNDDHEHLSNLRTFFERLRQCNITTKNENSYSMKPCSWDIASTNTESTQSKLMSKRSKICLPQKTSRRFKPS
ncbi:Transposon Ty3-I Gag-Pol polyprotein [Thelohanellus kitauei]|uniref:Transposon Ty3-I Gag-Pol polyprotein n=1 Tax=Thelohanellus kitauei TaxID=669202 RepID=A0A0C2N392_THEKT|nr:Transposon Ty3-I Gag-Pol polyprotein [Thelohanellus kitauei]